MTRVLVSLLLSGLILSAPCAADEMFMKNGSVLVGTLVRAEEGVIIFDTPYAGELRVKLANVERVITAETVTLLMADGRILRDRRIDSTEEFLVAKAEGESPVSFAATDIERVNPEPWRLGEGYRWTGQASTEAEFERGNSDTDEWDVDLRTVWRSLKDRYTFRGDFERERTNGRKTTDNWETRFKYDRFSAGGPEDYLGARARFKHDRFADLDLRTTVGPYIGREFVDLKALTLTGEIGPVWVDEQFDAADDNDFPGALWELEATSGLLGLGTELYAEHDGTFNFDEPEDLILNTTVGVRLPLLFGFDTRAEVEWEYDGGAVEDVDDLDETYTFRIGYTW